MKDKRIHWATETVSTGTTGSVLTCPPSQASRRLHQTSSPCPLPRNGGRVLAIHQGALGDLLLTLPVLNGLHHHCRVRLHLWTKPQHGELLKGLPFVEEVCRGMETDLTPFYHDELWEKAPLPHFFQRADAVIFFGQNSARAVCHRLSQRFLRPVLWIQSFPRENTVQSVSQFMADQFRSLQIPLENIPLRLKAPDHVFPELESRLRNAGIQEGSNPVVIHAGSGGKRKIWPLNQWLSLAAWLEKKSSRQAVTLLGPADSHLAPFAGELEKYGIPSLKNISLSHALALMNRACAYVGNDSGLSHLAALAGTTCIVLFGPTDPRVWAPRGENVHIVRTSWDDENNLNLSPPSPEVSPPMEAIQKLLLPIIS